MTLSPELLIAALLGLPLLGGAFALVVPAEDRLTLRSVGVVFGLLALCPGLYLAWLGGGVLRLPFCTLRFAGIALPAALTILGVTPMALRAGAPRVQRGLPAYVTAALVAESASLFAVLVDDAAAAIAAATVAAVPFFALVALFGGGERGTVTWRGASLFLLVDAAALGAIVVAPVAPAGPWQLLLVVCLLGPGLVRLAAGPHGLWAQPVLEQAPVAAACLMAGMVAPVGIVVLARAAAIVRASADPDAVAIVLPWLGAVLAISCAIGAALVAAERDLRRIVAHLLGALGSVAALVAVHAVTSAPGLAGQPQGATAGLEALPAVGLVGLTAFSAAVCLMLVEAVERRLETRKTTELQGLLHTIPSLGVLLPLSFLCLCGLPGPGVATALWPALATLVSSSSPGPGATADTGLAAFVCGFSMLVAAVGAANLVPRVVGQPRKRLGLLVRVSLRQGIRLLLPVAAVVAASLAHGVILGAARTSEAAIAPGPGARP